MSICYVHTYIFTNINFLHLFSYCFMMASTSEDIIQNLKIEIGQTRMELKAQQAANGKLRREKDAILKLLQECREDNW